MCFVREETPNTVTNKYYCSQMCIVHEETPNTVTNKYYCSQMCFVREETPNTVTNRKQSPIDITVLRCALCVRKH